MFDLPDAKRVRRSDLYTRSQSASPNSSQPDPELEAQFHARLASIYGPPSKAYFAPTTSLNFDTEVIDGDDEEADEEAEQEFEFRLFSTTTPGKSGDVEDGRPQKIILVDEEEDIGDGGFVVRERNREYYFTDRADGERRLGFEVMALSGEDVLSRARKRAWGLEVPWRVRILKIIEKKASGDVEEAAVGVEEADQEAKKKKSGKKRRIVLRERKKLREKLQEAKKVEMSNKEEAEREKRTRRNREKKIKRKMKEKAQKAGSTINDGGDMVVDPGEPSAVP